MTAEAARRGRELVPRRILASSLIVLGLWTFLAFSSALPNGLVNWDDARYIDQKSVERSLDLVAIFSEPLIGNYHPLSVLMLAVEHRLVGTTPWVFHLVNVLFHVANTLLVALLVLRLLPGRLVVALITAALFGLHPLHAESVAWISERKDVLSGFFSLIALLAYLSYLDAGGRRSYAVSLGAFLLAVLSKPMAVSVPVLLLSLDVLRRRGLGVRVWIEKLPFLAGSMLVGLANVYAQAPEAPTNLEIYDVGWLGRIWAGGEGIVFYVAKTLWPVRLSVVYDIELVSVGALEWTLFLAALVALAVWTARSPGLRREAVWGLAFFGISIALVLKLIPFGSYSLYNDRYMYVPSVGLFLVAALPFADSGRWRPVFRALAVVAFALVLAVLSVQTYTRCQVWRSSETLWHDVLRNYPESITALNNLAIALIDEREDFDGAEALLERAVALRPEAPHPHLALGKLHESRGDREAAARAYERAIELYPGSAGWRMDVARFYVAGGDYAMAIRHYQQIVEAYSDRAEPHHNLGDLYHRLGQTGRARIAYERALELDPNLGASHAALGRLHLQQGNERRALESFERARAAGTRVDMDQLRRLRARFRSANPGDSPPPGPGGGV